MKELILTDELFFIIKPFIVSYFQVLKASIWVKLCKFQIL